MLCWEDVASPLNVHLEQYEGPLDLLLDLIRKQEINVYDIPIAQITAQYLQYMQRALEMDIELGAEFVYMAATLIHIKSRMLLPRDPVLDEISPEEDPRTELVERLLEHERFKNAAEMLHQKRQIEEAVWSNPQIEQFLSEDETPGLAVTLHDLVRTFQEVLDRTRNRPIYELGKADVSVPDMIRVPEIVSRRHAQRRSRACGGPVRTPAQPPRHDLPVSRYPRNGEGASRGAGAAGSVRRHRHQAAQEVRGGHGLRRSRIGNQEGL